MDGDLLWFIVTETDVCSGVISYRDKIFNAENDILKNRKRKKKMKSPIIFFYQKREREKKDYNRSE